MVKKISISLSEYVYNLISQSKNKSRFIEELILRGYDLDSKEWENNKIKLSNLITENRNKDDEIKKLRIELGKINSEKKTKKKEYDINTMLAKHHASHNPFADF